MADGSEKDESLKLNPVPEDDVDQSELTALNVLREKTVVVSRITGNMEKEEEEDDDNDEEEYEEEEEEEKENEGEMEMVVVNNEEHNTDKVEDESKTENVGKEDANKGEESKEDDDKEEDEEQEEEEEEKINEGEKEMAVVKNEELNTNKVLDETKTENDGNEDANKRKDEEKVEEPKTGEELGEKLKKKRSTPRKIKKKDAQKESVMLAANGDKPASSSKTNGAQKSSVTLPANGEKPESSNKKKGSKRVESMGMVFMCTSKTKTDCFRYKILGLPGNKKDQVAKIYKGMRLFLFDVDLRLMYGIFKAAGAGGFNLEPKAFNTDFPSQVSNHIRKHMHSGGKRVGLGRIGMRVKTDVGQNG